MRILLVDDEEELVSAMAERLTLRGLSVDWARTAEQALEMVQYRDYEVAVVDIKMPKVSGLELKKRLEAIRPSLRFIFMSGHKSANVLADTQGELSDSNYYLLKPLDINHLLYKINELTSGSGR
ncbi:response regulator [Desulfobulbus alkaliphilus]|uniref:response regulator n=1 Tax=Desulfobulbus alkaliphilus TaxID=869814 RepID=UPI001963A502|nr:response regulator [Desulfobulbus alkaliphilus]MBM9538302.1 response regulator [Desulfobulbus alkaliphilus]